MRICGIDKYGIKIEEIKILGISKISSQESVSQRRGSWGYAMQIKVPFTNGMTIVHRWIHSLASLRCKGLN